MDQLQKGSDYKWHGHGGKMKVLELAKPICGRDENNLSVELANVR